MNIKMNLKGQNPLEELAHRLRLIADESDMLCHEMRSVDDIVFWPRSEDDQNVFRVVMQAAEEQARITDIMANLASLTANKLQAYIDCDSYVETAVSRLDVPDDDK